MSRPFTYVQVMLNPSDVEHELLRRKGRLYNPEVNSLMTPRIERAKELIQREPDLSEFVIAEKARIPILAVRSLIEEYRGNVR
mgnify:CR=1 FL=1